MKKRSGGFTIVELLIVIIVIAILTTITIVAYNGMSARARDTQRVADIAMIKKALMAYQIDNGDFAVANCGNGNGDGALESDYDGAGPKLSIMQCLINGKYLNKAIRDPSGDTDCSGTGCHAYWKYGNCGNGNTHLFANLETKAHTGTETDATCYSNADTNIGINHVVQVN